MSAAAKTQVPAKAPTLDSLLEQVIGMTKGAGAVDDLLDQVIAKTGTTKSRALATTFSNPANIAKIEQVLPKALKGEAARLVKRACLQFERSPSLQECTTASFIRCVLGAAELGLSIDGRLAHAVPYTNKGTKEAQLQLDYKGMIAVARRGGLISDCSAAIIHEADEFYTEEADGKGRFFHRPPRLGEDRGPVIGAWAKLVFPSGEARYEVMDLADLHGIRGRSKAWQTKGKGSTWGTDEGEMMKKTVLKRALKLYLDDPGIQAAVEADDAEYVTIDGEVLTTKPAPAPTTNGTKTNRVADKIRAGRKPVQPEPEANGNGDGDHQEGSQEGDGEAASEPPSLEDQERERLLQEFCTEFDAAYEVDKADRCKELIDQGKHFGRAAAYRERVAKHGGMVPVGAK